MAACPADEVVPEVAKADGNDDNDDDATVELGCKVQTGARITNRQVRSGGSREGLGSRMGRPAAESATAVTTACAWNTRQRVSRAPPHLACLSMSAPPPALQVMPLNGRTVFISKP